MVELIAVGRGVPGGKALTLAAWRLRRCRMSAEPQRFVCMRMRDPAKTSFERRGWPLGGIRHKPPENPTSELSPLISTADIGLRPTLRSLPHIRRRRPPMSTGSLASFSGPRRRWLAGHSQHSKDWRASSPSAVSGETGGSSFHPAASLPHKGQGSVLAVVGRSEGQFPRHRFIRSRRLLVEALTSRVISLTHRREAIASAV